MIVRFHFAENVDSLEIRPVFVRVRISKKAIGFAAFENRRIVLIGRQNAFAAHFESVLDHLEQGLLLRLAIDIPRSIENLMTAVF